MKQQELFNHQEEISDQIILKHDDAKSMLRFAAEVSGRPLKAIADDMGMDDKQFLRCLSYNPNDNRHFPFDLINEFQDIIDNEIPLRWLALKRGYGLVRLKSSLELENDNLRKQLEDKAREHEIILKVIKELKG